MAATGGFATFRQQIPTPDEVEVASFDFVDTRPLTYKTPISYLQELCVKKQVVPIYELLASEGRVHEPTFIYRVLVSDLSATGNGKSKKEAKHNAAKRFLEQIVAANLFRDWLIPAETKNEALDYLHSIIPEITGSKSSARPVARPAIAIANEPAAVPLAPNVDASIDLANTSIDDADNKDNPVGKLQEMCQNRNWPPPRYELIEERGMPHDKTFTINCYLGKFEQSSSAKNKRLAKRIAAEKMLKFLNELPLQKQEEGVVEEEAQEAETYNNAEAPGADLHSDLIEFGRMNLNEKAGCFTDDNEELPIPRLVELAEMDLTDKKPNAEMKTLLDEIGKEEYWTVDYTFLPRKSKNGEFQCLVNFYETGVCCGMGATRDEAMFAAAKEALEYLKIVNQP